MTTFSKHNEMLKEIETMVEKKKRKLQISNGYNLKFDQLARILNAVSLQSDNKKINRNYVEISTGLTNRQIKSLVSMSCSLGLIKPITNIFTSFGRYVFNYDPFFESIGTLEYCHYNAAGTYANLFWFDFFNVYLDKKSVFTYEDLLNNFRISLINDYSKHTIKSHVAKEVRFILDAYTNSNLRKLKLITLSTNSQYQKIRYSNPNPLILSAMIYDQASKNNTRLIQISDLVNVSGSPGKVFGMDEYTMRQNLENLHMKGWIRLESRHGLNQIRLYDGITQTDFISAYYEEHEPIKGYIEQ